MQTKIWVNYWVDITILIAFLISAITGIFKWPGLIPFFGGSYANWPMHTLLLLHDWSGLVMLLGVIVHLILHRKFLIVMTKRLFI